MDDPSSWSDGRIDVPGRLAWAELCHLQRPESRQQHLQGQAAAFTIESDEAKFIMVDALVAALRILRADA